MYGYDGWSGPSATDRVCVKISSTLVVVRVTYTLTHYVGSGATLPARTMLPASVIASVPLFSAGYPCTTVGVTPITSAELALSTSIDKGVVPHKTHMTSPKGPLLLSSSLPPVPMKVVEKIKAGQFIKFKELLTDNIALLQRLQEFGPTQANHALIFILLQINNTIQCRNVDQDIKMLLLTAVKTSERLYSSDVKRTPKNILQLYNCLWLHHIVFKTKRNNQ